MCKTAQTEKKKSWFYFSKAQLRLNLQLNVASHKVSIAVELIKCKLDKKFIVTRFLISDNHDSHDLINATCLSHL